MLKKFATLVAILMLTVLASACSGGAGSQESAEDYPSDEVRMIIPYAPGGPSDLVGRALAEHFQENLGEPVVVENLTGASGAVATEELISSAPDGYTVELATASSLTLSPRIENSGFNEDDVAPIGVAAEFPNVLAVSSDSKFETAEEFLEEAEANPGELAVAVPGANTTPAVELKRLNEIYGIEVQTVPFEGDAEAVNALVGGNVDALFDPTADVVYSRIESGDFKPLAIGSEERIPYLPDTPTLAELGYEELTVSDICYTPVVPKDTPPEIIAKLESALQEALQDPQVREQIGERNIPEEFSGAEEARQRLEESAEVYEPVAKELRDDGNS